MNYCVPDFDMDDEDYATPATSASPRPNKSTIGDQGELMELLWENGQPVLQSQTQRSFTKRPLIQDDAVAPPDRRANRSSPPIEPGLNNNYHLFMQEDEMAFWLHHYPPLHCTDLYSDVIDPASPRMAPPLSTAAAASQPRRSDAEKPEAVHHFAHISSRAKAKAVVEQGPSRTEVESREMPCAAAAAESVASRVAGSTVEVSGGVAGLCAAAGGRGGENGTCELMSSSGGSGSLEPVTEGDRKRKGPEADDYSEGPDEDVECESPDARKQVRGSTTPAKKSRIAEVHNLSERRRRDRINKKMSALQELIPGCNKSDKASMLDEAIEYLKSLQLQVQMMSMGCSMVPMMFPGIQQYMPPMGMAMGKGMEMGMSQPMLPFPSVLAGSALPTPAAAAYMGPRFPVPVFHMLSVPLSSPSNQSDPVLKTTGPQNRGQPQMMNFPGPYQQYPGLHCA